MKALEANDLVAAVEALRVAAASPEGTYQVASGETSALLSHVAVKGVPGERLRSGEHAERVVGFLRISGLERSHVQQVVARYSLVEAGMIQAAAWNPALTDYDVAWLAKKLWMGNVDRPGSLIPGARTRLGTADRVTARALSALSDAWWDSVWMMPPLALELTKGGTGAVEVYRTLARDLVLASRLSGIRSDQAETLVEQALLVSA